MIKIKQYTIGKLDICFWTIRLGYLLTVSWRQKEVYYKFWWCKEVRNSNTEPWYGFKMWDDKHHVTMIFIKNDLVKCKFV